MTDLLMEGRDLIEKLLLKTLSISNKEKEQKSML